ncbi:MAG: xylulose kinase [Actinobacteria bacterium]|nr:xylulose kinase [Actinomycetota bacterium]
MPRELLAGIDAGTTSVKVALLTPEGEQIALGRAPTTWERTTYGEETDAAALTRTARVALADALAQSPDCRIIGIGIASMAEAGVLVDEAGRVLAPVIAWHDHRDEHELQELIAELGGETYSATTGLPLWTQWSVTKHKWLTRHVPAVAAATKRFSVAEWLAYDLGAGHASEPSLASRTGMLDLRTATWWEPALHWAGAEASLFGPLVPAGTGIGAARGQGALAALDGAVVTVAGHDHQVAAIGMGAHRPGDEFDSAGTAEAILRTSTPDIATDAVRTLTAAGVTVGHHAAPGRWCLLGATQGGLILGKVMAALGVDRDGLPQLDQAAAAADDVPTAVTLGPGSGDVTIDPDAAPGEIWRAATRGITAQAAALSDRLTAASGPRRDLVVAGGWTHSAAVRDAKAVAFGPYRLSAVSEAGCRGAALLAGLAAGIYADLESAPSPETA